MPHLVYDGRTFDLADGELILGRHPECSVYVRDGRASRRNSRVFKADDGLWTIEDLDSANGTRVNGEEIFSPRKLAHGDVVSIGKARIWFTTESTVEINDTELTPEAGMPVLPVEKADPMEGATCGGCRILKLLGTGFAGAMYRAEMLSTGRAVALRLYRPEFAQRDAAFPQRMLEAIRAAARFSHPDAMPILDCGILDNRPWYATELVNGESLGERIDRDGRCEPRQAVEIALKAASVLAAGHAQGLCHLTLSPASILMDADGRMRLVDLGLGAALSGATDRRRAMPNPWHAAPERIAGETGDQRSDIYSLGALLYHLLIGEAPNAEHEPRPGDQALERRSTADAPVVTVCDQLPELPKRVDEILAGAMARLPAWRYGSMDEVVADLTRLQEQLAAPVRGGRPVPARAAAPPPRSATAGAEPRPPAALPGAGAAPLPPPVPRRTVRNHGGAGQWIVWGTVAVAVCYGAYHFGSQNQSKAESQRNAHLALVDKPRRDDGDTFIPTPPPTTPTATTGDGDALHKRWQGIEEQVGRYAAVNAWPRVDKTFQDFIATLPASAPATLTDAVRSKRQSLSTRGEAWYQERRAALPDQAGPRWAELNRLRDQVPPGHREDINLLLRETGVRLDQEVAALRAKAGRMVEDGRFEALATLSGAFRSLPPGAVVGSRVQSLRAQLTEVQLLKERWNTDWVTTRQQLGDVQGELVLAKAAAQFLTGADADALQTMTAIKDEDPLSPRRDRLLGMNVTDLTFTGPEDLQMLDMLQGEPRLTDRALTAQAGTACGIACTAPLSGATWRTEVVVEAKPAGDLPPQVAISLQGDDGKPTVQLRVAPDARNLRVQTAAGTEQFQPGPPTAGVMRLRFECRDGTLSVKDRDEPLAEVKGVTLLPGTRLQMDITGLDWRVTQIRVVAAP